MERLFGGGEPPQLLLGGTDDEAQCRAGTPTPRVRLSARAAGITAACSLLALGASTACWRSPLLGLQKPRQRQLRNATAVAGLAELQGVSPPAGFTCEEMMCHDVATTWLAVTQGYWAGNCGDDWCKLQNEYPDKGVGAHVEECGKACAASPSCKNSVVQMQFDWERSACFLLDGECTNQGQNDAGRWAVICKRSGHDGPAGHAVPLPTEAAPGPLQPGEALMLPQPQQAAATVVVPQAPPLQPLQQTVVVPQQRTVQRTVVLPQQTLPRSVVLPQEHQGPASSAAAVAGPGWSQSNDGRWHDGQPLTDSRWPQPLEATTTLAPAYSSAPTPPPAQQSVPANQGWVAAQATGVWLPMFQITSHSRYMLQQGPEKKPWEVTLSPNPGQTYLWQWVYVYHGVWIHTKSVAITAGPWQKPRCLPGFARDPPQYQNCEAQEYELKAPPP